MLSSLERHSTRWDSDPEAARDALSASISLVLRLLGRESDPAKSREHVLLSVLAERRLAAGESAELAELMQDVLDPPIDETNESAQLCEDEHSARERASEFVHLFHVGPFKDAKRLALAQKQ
jgi:hypothetical protein